MSRAALNSSSFSMTSRGRFNESSEAAVARALREEESLDAIEGRVLLLVLLLEMAEMGCSLGVICAGVSLSRFWRSEFFFFLVTAAVVGVETVDLGSFLICFVVGLRGCLSSATGDWGEGMEMESDGGGLSAGGEDGISALLDMSQVGAGAALDALVEALDALALVVVVAVDDAEDGGFWVLA